MHRVGKSSILQPVLPTCWSNGYRRSPFHIQLHLLNSTAGSRDAAAPRLEAADSIKQLPWLTEPSRSAALFDPSKPPQCWAVVVTEIASYPWTPELVDTGLLVCLQIWSSSPLSGQLNLNSKPPWLSRKDSNWSRMA